MRRNLNPNDELERMIDRSSLAQVLEDIAEISYLKAAHIEENWQDMPLARKWERAGKAVDGAARKVRKIGLP
jgi:hypothetical protein